jgi:hypothetical protein
VVAGGWWLQVSGGGVSWRVCVVAGVRWRCFVEWWRCFVAGVSGGGVSWRECVVAGVWWQRFVACVCVVVGAWWRCFVTGAWWRVCVVAGVWWRCFVPNTRFAALCFNAGALGRTRKNSHFEENSAAGN